MVSNEYLDRAIRTHRKHKAGSELDMYPLMVSVINEMKSRNVTFLPKHVVKRVLKPIAKSRADLEAGLVLQGGLGLGNRRYEIQ